MCNLNSLLMQVSTSPCSWLTREMQQWMQTLPISMTHLLVKTPSSITYRIVRTRRLQRLMHLNKTLSNLKPYNNLMRLLSALSHKILLTLQLSKKLCHGCLCSTLIPSSMLHGDMVRKYHKKCLSVLLATGRVHSLTTWNWWKLTVCISLNSLQNHWLVLS